MVCKQCGAETDSAPHMVEECPDFAVQRATLVREIGRGLCPAALVKALLEGGAQRKALISFRENVMKQKEARPLSGVRTGGSAAPGVVPWCGDNGISESPCEIK